MAQSFNTSLKNVAALYLQLLQAKVTVSSVKKEIEENPYYPSLLSLSDTFNRYQINNNAYEITSESFTTLETPFVAFMNIPGIGKDFVLVRNSTNKTVTYLYKSKRPQTVEKNEFLKQYQNVVWVAESHTHSGEADYLTKLKEEKTIKIRKIAWITAIIILIVFAISTNINTANLFAFITIALIKLIGSATAVLLLVYETDKTNAFVKNICSAGGHTNCDAVLGSRGAKILGVSWGEIGFIYFSATTLWLLLPNISFADKKLWLAIANAFAAPYILFSIYYQWHVVKKWCPLCLAVQVVIFSELLWSIISFWNINHSLSFNHFQLMIGAFCILLPIVSWYGLKPVIVKAKDADLYKSAFKRLQYNPQIFIGLLQQQAKAPDGWQHLGIKIGNPAGINKIIKVCNPYCGPCARVHPILEDILKHSSNVELTIIFKVKNGEQDIEATVVKHLLAIAAEDNIKKTQQSLDDWYLADQKYYNLFATKYPLNSKLECQNAKIKAMSIWCDEAEITHTPFIFVNGYKLPENYSIEELKNIL